jgi:hypothetical protein
MLKPLFQVLVNSDPKDKREIREEGEGRQTRQNMFIVSLVQLVISLDSVVAGADFMEFK